MPRSATSARKAATLSKRLHRDIAAYALAAGAAGVSALALASPSEAQIVYTPAHEIIGSNGQMLVDLNHDGVTDLMIREVPCSEGTSFYNANSLQAVPRGSGGGIRMGGYLGFAAALSPRAKIGGVDPFVANFAVMANWTNDGAYYFGSWVSAKSLYLGIRFTINGETHYGWARLNAMYSYQRKDIVALLTGYAYETQPNAGIRAGDTGKNDPHADPANQMSLPQDLDAARHSAPGALALGASSASYRCGGLRGRVQ